MRERRKKQERKNKDQLDYLVTFGHKIQLIWSPIHLSLCILRVLKVRRASPAYSPPGATAAPGRASSHPGPYTGLYAQITQSQRQIGLGTCIQD